MNENLPLFATLTLVVHVTGAASDTTATGAQMFFWSRVAHAALYTAGVPYLRTVAWAISVFGMLIVGEALL